MTLVELAVVSVVMLVAASLALPMLQRDAGSRSVATFTLLRDDLEQARHRTIADPERPVRLVLDADGRGWSLVTDVEGRAIIRHDGRPWHVRLGEDSADQLDGILVTRRDRPGQLELRFDASGVILGDVPPMFEIRDRDSIIHLRVGLVTGVIRLVKD